MLLAACAQESTGNPEDYPSRNIRLITPFPAGLSADWLARLYAKCSETELGQPVLVENRAGGNGTIGMKSSTPNPTATRWRMPPPAGARSPPMLTPDAGYDATSTSPTTSLKQLFSTGDHVVVATSGSSTSSGLNVKGLMDNYGLKADQIAYCNLSEGQRGLAHGDYDLLVHPARSPS